MRRMVMTAGAAAVLVASGMAIGVQQAGPERPGVSEEARADREAPRIAFERFEHNFGRISDDRNVRTTFSFTNRGESTLKILDTRTTCGCAVPELAKTEYAPGESGEITVIFNPNNRRGAQDRHVTIMTNDPISPSIGLRVQADVQPLIEIEPMLAQFGEIRRGNTSAVLIELAGRYDEFEVTHATVTRGEGVSVEVMPTEKVDEENGIVRRAGLMISLDQEQNIGRLFAQVTVRLTDPDGQLTLRTVNVTGEIVGDLRLVPGRLNLGMVGADGRFTRQVRVMSNDGKPFKIVGHEERPLPGLDGNIRPAQLDGLKVEIVALDEEEEYPTRFSVIVRGRAVEAGGPVVNTRLVLKTDREDEPEVIVPISGRLQTAGGANPPRPGEPVAATGTDAEAGAAADTVENSRVVDPEVAQQQREARRAELQAQRERLLAERRARQQQNNNGDGSKKDDGAKQDDGSKKDDAKD